MTKWKILLITAHPDDEAGCGGTLAKLADEGHSITIAVATNGNRGTQDPEITAERLAALRHQEMLEAARILGVKKVIGLGYDDGTLEEQRELKERIYRLIRTERPDVVMTLDGWRRWEFHPDHRAIGMAAAEAAYLADSPRYFPEHAEEGIQPWKPKEVYLLWSEEPNYTVDITATWERKLRAADAHVSQGQDGSTFGQKYLSFLEHTFGGGGRLKQEHFRKIYGTSYKL